MPSPHSSFAKGTIQTGHLQVLGETGLAEGVLAWHRNRFNDGMGWDNQFRWDNQLEVERLQMFLGHGWTNNRVCMKLKDQRRPRTASKRHFFGLFCLFLPTLTKGL